MIWAITQNKVLANILHDEMCFSIFLHYPGVLTYTSVCSVLSVLFKLQNSNFGCTILVTIIENLRQSLKNCEVRITCSHSNHNNFTEILSNWSKLNSMCQESGVCYYLSKSYMVDMEISSSIFLNAFTNGPFLVP